MANLPTLSDKIPDLGDRAPTPDEIIEWLNEQAFTMGRIGFTTVFSPEQFIKNFQVEQEHNPDPGPTCRESTVATELEFMTGQWQREQWILKKMYQHQRVVKQAAVILDKRLLAAGMSEDALAKLKKRTESPLQKVIELYKLENPQPKGPEQVKVKILKQTDKGTKLQEIYLFENETLNDLSPALNRLSGYMNGRGEFVCNEASGPWMYQLLERASTQKNKAQPKGKSPRKPKAQAPAENPRKCLRSNADLRELFQLLRKEGGKAPFAILCQESTVKFEKELAAQKEKEDEIWSGGLDEDGKPYFQDVDWDMMIDKKFGKAADVTSKARAQPSRRSARLMSHSPVKQG
ncbi:hypothetical protein MMC30_007189 [Trapelia coarctata]|nr:hypothetical protein [Trapelia coarctata]